MIESLVNTTEEDDVPAKKAKPDIHVQPSGDGKWRVTRRGQGRAIAVTDTQKSAIDRGREVARRDKAELNVHGRDGRVRDKWSYGNDPRDIPG